MLKSSMRQGKTGGLKHDKEEILSIDRPAGAFSDLRLYPGAGPGMASAGNACSDSLGNV